MVKFGKKYFFKPKKSFNPIQVLVTTKAPGMLDFTSCRAAFKISHLLHVSGE
jgi:hypothetical protein